MLMGQLSKEELAELKEVETSMEMEAQVEQLKAQVKQLETKADSIVLTEQEIDELMGYVQYAIQNYGLTRKTFREINDETSFLNRSFKRIERPTLWNRG